MEGSPNTFSFGPSLSMKNLLIFHVFLFMVLMELHCNTQSDRPRKEGVWKPLVSKEEEYWTEPNCKRVIDCGTITFQEYPNFNLNMDMDLVDIPCSDKYFSFQKKKKSTHLVSDLVQTLPIIHFGFIA
ncbi:unnamed protein product [Cuscuta europaea]|uniref:Uncharacterized protein n=1 Tax=Cuscuta europaea TaxID=41803 RepID=A0A9P1E0B6_CUSEU|nr:unnamed protein product [Cuscuta europaea]